MSDHRYDPANPQAGGLPSPPISIRIRGVDHNTCTCGTIVLSHIQSCPRCGKGRDEIERSKEIHGRPTS